MDQFELFKKNLSHANTYVKAISKSSLEVLWDIRKYPGIEGQALISPHRGAPKLKWSKLNSKYQISRQKDGGQANNNDRNSK